MYSKLAFLFPIRIGPVSHTWIMPFPRLKTFSMEVFTKTTLILRLGLIHVWEATSVFCVELSLRCTMYLLSFLQSKVTFLTSWYPFIPVIVLCILKKKPLYLFPNFSSVYCCHMSFSVVGGLVSQTLAVFFVVWRWLVTWVGTWIGTCFNDIISHTFELVSITVCDVIQCN